MTYRVFWAPHAEAQLDAMLNIRSEQARLAAAARRIDERLVRDPGGFGESRYDKVRIGFEVPLGIHFEILQDVRTVIVYDVWRIDRKASRLASMRHLPASEFPFPAFYIAR